MKPLDYAFLVGLTVLTLMLILSLGGINVPEPVIYDLSPLTLDHSMWEPNITQFFPQHHGQ